jgi:uncharacterized protein (TIGR03437 family)
MTTRNRTGKRERSALGRVCGVLVRWMLVFAGARAIAQTTNFTATLTFTESNTASYDRIFLGTGSVATLGKALLRLDRIQDLGADYESGVGPVRGSLRLVFNREDQITIANAQVADPSAETVTVTGRVVGGTGAYAGATGPAGGTNLNLTRISTTPPRYKLSFAGTAIVGAQTLNLAIAEAEVSQAAVVVNVFDNLTGTASITPFGQAKLTGTVRPDTDRWDKVHFLEVVLNAALSDADGLQMFLRVPPVETLPPDMPVIIAGGTGAFAGASGEAFLNVTGENTGTLRGTIRQAGPTTPIITSVNVASGRNRIAQNTWIEIKGRNLVPPDTPAGGVYWSNAPEFAEGNMPAELGGISATVNGKPAYVWWFCSAITTSFCTTDQINVLTPLDDFAGQVPVVVKKGAELGGAFLDFEGSLSPSFLVFSGRGHVTATHADGSLVGPASLFPGLSTPAKTGETISLWGVGFGLPVTALVAGSARQSGALPETPVCYLDGSAVPVVAALVSPGLYQFNVPIPDRAAPGENHFYCTLGNDFTPDVLLTIE